MTGRSSISRAVASALPGRDHDVRIEMMPLIDVIFLLLTFFIYAMVLMRRVDLLPVEMQPIASGEVGEAAPAITVTLDRTGTIIVDGTPVTLETAREAIETAKTARGATIVYLAPERDGDMDRLPGFLALYDELAWAGFDLRLVGPPAE